jgi:23S rRNA (adenine2503-C2)-methyltransferase
MLNLKNKRFTLDHGKYDLKSMTFDEIKDLFHLIGESPIRAQRTFQALWQSGVSDFNEMYKISPKTRTKLSEIAEITMLKSLSIQDAEDGTRKFLWQTAKGAVVESVLIPQVGQGKAAQSRLTLCISSQWGCAMQCGFCLTGDLGLKGQLSASEIANQVLQVNQHLPAGKKVTHIVFMGMGEPLHNLDAVMTSIRILMHTCGINLSHRNITVSTVGLIPQLQDLANALPVNLAVSLNASTQEQRLQVMPISRKYPLHDLLEACRTLPLTRGRRVTFEYVMMAGFNDSLNDAQRLLDLLKDTPSKINLIPYNENPDREILRPSEQQIDLFYEYIASRGLQCSIRRTRGIDITAACGQLGKAWQNIHA